MLTLIGQGRPGEKKEGGTVWVRCGGGGMGGGIRKVWEW